MDSKGEIIMKQTGEAFNNWILTRDNFNNWDVDCKKEKHFRNKFGLYAVREMKFKWYEDKVYEVEYQNGKERNRVYFNTKLTFAKVCKEITRSDVFEIIMHAPKNCLCNLI